MTIDADFLCERGQIANIVPYLPEGWREFLRLGEMGGSLGSVWALPETIYQSARTAAPAVASVKRDSGSSDVWGRSWATDSDEIADPAAGSAFLDRHGIEQAVLNPGTAPNLSALWNPALGATVASAVNDWLVERWLDADQRFLGSIVVGPRDPKRAAEEVERLARNGRMAQVLIGYPQHLIGNRFFAPLHEVANEYGLAITLQAGGAYVGGNRGVSGTGYPGSVFEYELGWEYAGQPHLVSAVTSGLLEKYPNLRLILNGYGIGWLPALLWKMDLEYGEERIEIPAALSKRPSEHVYESVRFTTTPLGPPAEAERYVKLLELADAGKLLLYGSGPHRLEPSSVELLPSEWQQSVLHDNAQQAFGRAPVAA